MSVLHRIRTPFVFVNALLMVLFGLGAATAPELLWGLAGVTVEASGVVRLTGWYLLVFGVGGLLVARHPERHPIIIALIGIEKIGPAVVFPLLYVQGEASALLAFAGVGDGLLALIFIAYALWLNAESESGVA